MITEPNSENTDERELACDFMAEHMTCTYEILDLIPSTMWPPMIMSMMMTATAQKRNAKRVLGSINFDGGRV